MKRLIPLVCLLSACGTSVSLPGNQPSATPSVQPDTGAKPGTGLFSNALNKRSLALNLFGNQAPSAESAQASGSTGSNPATTAPAAIPAAAPMPPGGGKADARLAMPGYGGGEFNNYVLQFAEESDFPASKAQSLLNAYSQTVKPLLAQWDAQARLIESQAFAGQAASEQNGGFYLPDSQGKPQLTQVKFLFRLASTQRKETLIIYLTDDATRVHRLVWGESRINPSKVSLDSTQAQALALKAFSSQGASTEYTIYPDQSYPGQTLVYAIPSQARWTVNLNQTVDQTRYFVSVSFDQAGNNGNQTLYGSAEIDALSGKLVSLNRPVIYADTKIDYPAPPPLAVPPSSPDDPRVQ